MTELNTHAHDSWLNKITLRKTKLLGNGYRNKTGLSLLKCPESGRQSDTEGTAGIARTCYMCNFSSAANFSRFTYFQARDEGMTAEIPYKVKVLPVDSDPFNFHLFP